jgi:hypothetical protein
MPPTSYCGSVQTENKDTTAQRRPLVASPVLALDEARALIGTGCQRGYLPASHVRAALEDLALTSPTSVDR